VTAPPTASPDVPLGPPVEEWITSELQAYQTGLADFELYELSQAIERESTRYGLRRELVLAVMRTESGFYNWARSRVGALGLMQIMPATGKMLARQLGIRWNGPQTLFEPVTNVRLGVAYLARLHSRYGNWTPALAAYNWGPGAIDRHLRRGRSLPVGYTARVFAALDAPTVP
jgi:soluble lytic murein transglycosylase-like protein